MSRRSRIGSLTAALIAGSALLGGAAAARAATVTIGSALGANLTSTTIIANATVGQEALPGRTTVAPFNGTITSWSVTGGMGGPFELRVIRPLGGGFTGGGTAVSGPITGTGVLTFQANLPIRAGDRIGLDLVIGERLGTQGNVDGALYYGWAPPLADGGPGRGPDQTGDRELGFNATVLSNCIVPKLKGKKVKAAKKALRNAGCDPGKVKGKKGKRSRVRKQNPAAGTEVPGGTDVSLKVAPKR